MEYYFVQIRSLMELWWSIMRSSKVQQSGKLYMFARQCFCFRSSTFLMYKENLSKIFNKSRLNELNKKFLKAQNNNNSTIKQYTFYHKHLCNVSKNYLTRQPHLKHFISIIMVQYTFSVMHYFYPQRHSTKKLVWTSGKAKLRGIYLYIAV